MMDGQATNDAGEQQDPAKTVAPGLWPALKGAASDRSAQKSAKAGAAIAYYSIFSIGPLIVVVISLARGTGVAKHLVKAILSHARERVELLQLAVVSENETAQRLYRNFGFAEYGNGVHALKQSGRYYDEVLMAVALNPTSN
jgi:GNAT superfamily N-acetyltransferase